MYGKREKIIVEERTTLWTRLKSQTITIYIILVYLLPTFITTIFLLSFFLFVLNIF